MNECDPNGRMPLTCANKFQGIEHRLTVIEQQNNSICRKLDEIRGRTSKWESRLWGMAKGVVLLCVGWFLAKLGGMR